MSCFESVPSYNVLHTIVTTSYSTFYTRPTYSTWTTALPSWMNSMSYYLSPATELTHDPCKVCLTNKHATFMPGPFLLYNPWKCCYAVLLLNSFLLPCFWIPLWALLYVLNMYLSFKYIAADPHDIGLRLKFDSKLLTPLAKMAQKHWKFDYSLLSMLASNSKPSLIKPYSYYLCRVSNYKIRLQKQSAFIYSH